MLTRVFFFLHNDIALHEKANQTSGTNMGYVFNNRKISKSWGWHTLLSSTKTSSAA